MGNVDSVDLHDIGPGPPHQNVPNVVPPLMFTGEENRELCDLLGRFLTVLHNWERLQPGCSPEGHPVTVARHQLRLQ